MPAAPWPRLRNRDSCAPTAPPRQHGPEWRCWRSKRDLPRGGAQLPRNTAAWRAAEPSPGDPFARSYRRLGAVKQLENAGAGGAVAVGGHWWRSAGAQKQERGAESNGPALARCGAPAQPHSLFRSGATSPGLARRPLRRPPTLKGLCAAHIQSERRPPSPCFLYWTCC